MRGVPCRLRSSFATGENLPAISGGIDPTPWNKHINWGNHRIGGGLLKPDANAWRLDVIWGAATTDAGETIVWGSACSAKDCGSHPRILLRRRQHRLGHELRDAQCSDVVWGPSTEDNIVWGTACGGATAQASFGVPTAIEDECPTLSGAPRTKTTSSGERRRRRRGQTSCGGTASPRRLPRLAGWRRGASTGRFIGRVERGITSRIAASIDDR